MSFEIYYKKSGYDDKHKEFAKQIYEDAIDAAANESVNHYDERWDAGYIKAGGSIAKAIKELK